MILLKTKRINLIFRMGMMNKYMIIIVMIQIVVREMRRTKDSKRKMPHETNLEYLI